MCGFTIKNSFDIHISKSYVATRFLVEASFTLNALQGFSCSSSLLKGSSIFGLN